ncbi:zf-HC2 domain-containing protein [bacterium]|nr:zf-HC2 domain-containing protein [bacterium]
MKSCTNKEIGHMVHAFEIGVLSDEDKDRFIAHLLECDHCFEKVQSLRKAVGLIRFDQDIRSDVQQVVAVAGEAERKAQSWYQKLVVLPAVRFAAAAALVLVVALPVVWSVLERGGPKTLQTVSLSPTRSVGNNIITMGLGDAVEVRFVLPGAGLESAAIVTISPNGGAPVYVDSNFHDFDQGGLGSITVPLQDFSPGIYQLQVRDAQDSTTAGERTYVLLVKPPIEE